MAIKVTPLGAGGLVLPPIDYPTATMMDVDFDHLFVYAGPDQVLAAYSKGYWASAVVS